jgi:hypothetical protein
MIIIFGKCVLDNVHCQDEQLTYSELIAEDSRDLLTCTETEI